MADQKHFGPHHHHDLIGDNPRPEEEYKPGRVATLDEMLETSREIAETDTRDGLNTRHVCEHICNCICHKEPGVMHIMACCDDCPKCHANIGRFEMSSHLSECHPEDK